MQEDHRPVIPVQTTGHHLHHGTRTARARRAHGLEVNHVLFGLQVITAEFKGLGTVVLATGVFSSPGWSNHSQSHRTATTRHESREQYTRVVHRASVAIALAR